MTQASNFFRYKDTILMSHTVKCGIWQLNNKLCPRLDQAARVLQCTHKEKRLQEHMNLTSTTELIIVIVALFISVISFVVYSCTCDSIAHINNIFFLWIELRKITNIY